MIFLILQQKHNAWGEDKKVWAVSNQVSAFEIHLNHKDTETQRFTKKFMVYCLVKYWHK